MKKFVIFILVIGGLIFTANAVYTYYSRNFVNSHEAVVLINDNLSENEIDDFFGLPSGTFNPAEHKVIYCLPSKSDSILDDYLILPTKNASYFSSIPYHCDNPYEEVRHFGIYDYEIERYILARIIKKDANLQMTRFDKSGIISEKILEVKFAFGEINVIEISKERVVNRCTKS